MENQHRKITGYRELSEREIELMNAIKAQGELLETLFTEVNRHLYDQEKKVEDDPISGELAAEVKRLKKAEPKRWSSMAKTSFQHGLIELTRAVAQPTSF